MRSKSKLFDAILGAKWCNVPSHLHEVRNLDDDGSTALHYACNNGAPAHVIEILLNSFPEAALIKDRWGQTPLYRSVYWNSPETVKLIMQFAPNSASIPNALGETPLHMALEYRYSPRLTETLVKFYPMSIQIKNRHSITPIEAFFSKWEFSITNILSLTSETASPDYILNQVVVPQNGGNSICVMKIMDLVQYLYILLKAACPPREDATPEEQNNWFPLHASIVLPTCPWSIRYLMLRIHPEQIILKDSYGNLAIVYLATMENNINIDANRQKNLATSLLMLSMMFQMIKECPTLISHTLNYSSGKRRRT